MSDLEKVFQKYLEAKKGLVPQSDFFMMQKIMNTDSKDIDQHPTKSSLFKAIQTIFRFKSESLIFRSLDMIKGIQKSIKGDN